MRSSLGIAVVLLAATALAGCGQRPAAKPQPAPSTTSGYQSPPVVLVARREADGGVHLSGHAPPDALVRLRAPEGGELTAHSDDQGAWTLDVTSSETPHLYAFEAVAGGQTLRGEGALAIMPHPAVGALVLRAGYAAAPASGSESGGLTLSAFDYDPGGVAAAGFAAPGSPVRLSVDGAVAGLSKADSQGRFAILAIDLRSGVADGAHTVRVETPQGLAVERRVQVRTPAVPADRAYAADRVDGGWALTWRLPGGGTQTCLVFDAASAAAPAR